MNANAFNMRYCVFLDRRYDYLATASAQDAEALDLGVGIAAEANGIVRRETGGRQRVAKFSSIRSRT